MHDLGFRRVDPSGEQRCTAAAAEEASRTARRVGLIATAQGDRLCSEALSRRLSPGQDAWL